MRMANGVIHLVRPVFGCSYLAGPATVGPTWVEYTFTSEQLPASTGRQASTGAELPIGHRVLIPLTNVIAIAIADEVDEQDGEHVAADRSAAEKRASVERIDAVGNGGKMGTSRRGQRPPYSVTPPPRSSQTVRRTMPSPCADKVRRRWQRKGAVEMIPHIHTDHMDPLERRARWQS